MNISIDVLKKLPTLCVGQVDDLKVETDTIRIWLSRVDDTVSMEQLINGRWEIVKE